MTSSRLTRFAGRGLAFCLVAFAAQAASAWDTENWEDESASDDATGWEDPTGWEGETGWETAWETGTDPGGLAHGQPGTIAEFDSVVQSRTTVETQQTLEIIDAFDAQAISQGTGVVVAVLDGGFDKNHEMLEGHLSPWAWDCIDEDADVNDLGDGIDNDNDGYIDWLAGHGTFAASIVRATAPGVTIMPIRVLDAEGNGCELDVAQGIDYAIAHGAKIINMSLVVPNASITLTNALRRAAFAGVTVVAASGNLVDVWYWDQIVANRVLSVGSTDEFDTLSWFSITGQWVDCYVPGEMVYGGYGAQGHDYAQWTGTSFSCAFAAGAAAMLKSDNPTLQPFHICMRLRSSGELVEGATGTGRRINILEALDYWY